jgi:hypothetical protein
LHFLTKISVPERVTNCLVNGLKKNARRMEIVGSKDHLFREYCRKKLSAQKEFIRLFYQILDLSSTEGRDVTPRQAFQLLNDVYFRLTGKYRFKTYELFLLARIRLERQAQNRQKIGAPQSAEAEVA